MSVLGKRTNLNFAKTGLKAAARLFLALSACLVTPAAVADINADVETRVQSILQEMSLEQKVGQMVQGEIKWVSPSDVTKYHLGSVLNGGGSFPGGKKNSSIDDWVNLADKYYKASMKTKAGIPVIWGTDAVHGHNNVIGATLFPHNIGLGAANDPELLKEIGAITAREVAVTGIDWIFAPTVAVVKDDRWGRTYEGYSDEPPIVRSYGGKIVEGIQGTAEQLRTDPSKVIATAKHWIGDGGTLRGVDQGNTIVSLEDLLDQHGQGYITALEADVQTVMASFNSWNGEKLHGHKELLTNVLKEQMNFDGFVVSDWNGIGQVDGCTNQSCAQSINAGVDMIMAPE
ncbi:MAG: glycoside hydrolase family 3 protein, partial [Porticoccaceae bacterium]